MCRFTENLMLEFKYLNKRLEDKILFQVGYYQDMPEDTRGPRECWLRLDKDIKDKVRPVSAVNHKLDFDMALNKATDQAGDRLRNAYQNS